ncbi:DUF6090 family protein [Winogradskyella sp. PE311]|uniref:DUF6090 family protein n=1 Tax=Winogradskyella sp. PE311 TaxID=3366943 RepID=UPI0039804B16
MIKFFSRFRQQLLSENKFSKYLLYAIGEIALVMIGILLALQVNNWNENRKKETLKNEYKTALINDYTKDTIQVNDRLLRNNLRIERINSLGDSLRNGHFNNLESYYRLYNEEFVGIRVTNVYNTNSFNLLISSGKIDLFDKDLRKELMELNRLQTFEKTVQDGNRDYLMDFMQNLASKYSYGSPLNKNITEQLLWKDVKVNDLPRDLVNYLQQERYTISRYLELTDDVLQQTELVLNLLHQTND